MGRKRDVQIGERFRPVGLTSFGDPFTNVFEVHEIRVENCIIPHANLVNLTNPSDRRLISVDALRDRSLYLASGSRSNAGIETEVSNAE